MKAEIDQIDVDELKPVPADLSKLSNVVNNEVFKFSKVNDKLVATVNNIDTSGFVLKTMYNDKSKLEKKISDEDKNILDTSRHIKKQIIMLKLVKY